MQDKAITSSKGGYNDMVEKEICDETLDAGFAGRLTILLNKANLPEYGRQAYLAKQFNVSKRTPGLWLSGNQPRRETLDELAKHFKTLAGLEHSTNTIVAWLIVGVPEIFETSNPDITYGPGLENKLDYFTKAKIYAAIHKESKALNVDVYALESDHAEKLLNVLVNYVYENMDRAGSNLFDDEGSDFFQILRAQLLLLSKNIYP